jgi:hypothetical protein
MNDQLKEELDRLIGEREQLVQTGQQAAAIAQQKQNEIYACDGAIATLKKLIAANENPA